MIHSAQEYLRQFQAGNVPRAMSGLASSLVSMHMGEIQLRTGSSFGIGFGRGNPWADLPTPMAGRMVRFGTQPQVFMGGLVNLATKPEENLRFSPMDPWGNLQDIVTSTLGKGVDSSRVGLSLRPQLGLWAARHLQDLNASGGGINIGMVPTASRRRKLFFNDSGFRARALADASRNFMNAVLGNHENTHRNYLTDSLNTYRRFYLDEVSKVLRQVSPDSGAHLNIHGIKDASFQLIRRFQGGNWIQDTEMLVNTGSPHQYRPFGNISDQVSGDQHINQFIAISSNKGIKGRRHFSEGKFHPLVTGSSYGDDLTLMAKGLGKKMGTFGTQVSADVGYLYGGMAELFASRAFGDSGSLITSTRMMHASGLSSLDYKLKVSGPVGMFGLPSPTTTLDPTVMSLPGVSDFLASNEQRYLQFDNPMDINRRILATYKSGKKITAINKADKILGIQKTAEGIRLLMQRDRPVHKTGRPVLIGGVRATLGVGPGMGIDILTQGMKSSDPAVVRERWAAHYASKVFGLRGLSRNQRSQALLEFGSFSGLGSGTYGKGRIYLHTNSNWMQGSFANPTEFMSHGFREKLATHLNTKLGLTGGTSFTADLLSPVSRKLGRRKLINILMHGGRMSEASASSAYSSIRTQARKRAIKEATSQGLTGKDLRDYVNNSVSLSYQIMEGQGVKFRATNVDAEKFRVRVLEAKTLRSKLIDYSGAGDDFAKKAAGIIGGNIEDIQRYVKFAQGAQVAPLMGTEAVELIARESKGKINILKLSDIANQGLFDEINTSLQNTGSMSPELADRLYKNFGMEKGTFGSFIDLRGSHLQGMEIFSGARDLSSKDAATAASDFLFLHNIRRVAPGIDKSSTTGNIADMSIIPRRPVVAGLDPHKNKALGSIANTFNVYFDLLNPYAGRGAMEERMWLMNASVREMMTGSKGLISHKAMTGFVGGRYTAQALGTVTDDLAVGLTEKGIKRAFGRKQGSLGQQMIDQLRTGKDVFAFYKRDPVQSAQQIVPVRLHLIEKQKMEAETMWVSRLLAGVSQADFDSDKMNLFLMSQGKNAAGQHTMPFLEQQTLVRGMYEQTLEQAKPFASMLDQQMLAGDETARRLMRLAGGSPLTAIGIAQSMAGGSEPGSKWDDVVRPLEATRKTLLSIGYKESEIDTALMSAYGGFQRRIQGGGGVGTMHSFATRQQAVLNALTDDSTNPFSMPRDKILSKARELGIDNLTASKNADYIRFIYGFLKKGTKATEATLRSISALSIAPQLSPDSQAYRLLTTELASNIKEMSSGVSGSKRAFYTFAEQGALQAAKNAAGLGLSEIEDDRFYQDMAHKLMNVSRLERYASKHGLNAASRMGTTRNPKDFLHQLFSEFMGNAGESVLPGTSSAGSVLNASMMEKGYVAGSINPGNINQTIADAAHGVGQSIDKATDLAGDFGKTKAWGAMKLAGLTIGAFALIDAITSKNKATPPAPYIESGSSQSPMPPSPQVAFPSDGARPSALAPRVNTARINRVQGQRRHFGGEDQVFMPAPYDVMDGFRSQSLGGSRLGDLPNLMPTLGSAEDSEF
jgi:hypothetical protein